MNGFKTLSSYFDDTIDRLFGVPLKDIFSFTEALARKAYTDPEGTTATYILTDKNGKREEHFYVDGEEVDSLPEHIVRKMKRISNTGTCIQPITQANRLPSPLIKGSDFPALDMYLVEDGGLEIVAAVAGIDTDRISLSFDNDYLKIKIIKAGEASEDLTADKLNRKACLVKGIKAVDGECYKDIFIDPNKYDAEGLKYSFEGGLLKIYIPKSKNIRSFVFKSAVQNPSKVEESCGNCKTNCSCEKSSESNPEEDPKESE